MRIGSRFKHNRSAFARAAGLTRVTTTHVENVDGDPDYRPDIDTIIAWLHACQWPRSLVAFLAPFDSSSDERQRAADRALLERVIADLQQLSKRA